MPNGSLSLGEYPTDMVTLACSRCARRGRYRKARLVALYGPATPLPTVRHLIADCPNATALGRACGVYYVELVPTPD